jgi:hypothetical protein
MALTRENKLDGNMAGVVGRICQDKVLFFCVRACVAVLGMDSLRPMDEGRWDCFSSVENPFM